jgi:hypothetical protein
VAPRTRGLLPLPPSSAALAAELERLERELARTEAEGGRKLLAIERRRVVCRLDALEAGR